MSNEKLIQPDNAGSYFSYVLPLIYKSIVGIVCVSDTNQILAGATGVLVKIRGKKFVFSAEHVLSEAKSKWKRISLVLPVIGKNGSAVNGLFLIPEMSDIEKAQIIWVNQELDAGAIWIQDNTPIPSEHFIAGDDHARRTRECTKPDVSKLLGSKFMLPFIVTGFPNFGRFKDEQLRVHGVTCFSAFAEVSTWESDQSLPFESRMPQCTFNLPQYDEHVMNQEFTVWENCLNQKACRIPGVNEIESFGGMSGGPIFRIAPNGIFLSAIIKEGRKVFERVHLIASSWDDVYYSFVKDCVKLLGGLP